MRCLAQSSAAAQHAHTSRRTARARRSASRVAIRAAATDASPRSPTPPIQKVTITLPSRDLQFGDSGRDVCVLQKHLGLEPTGARANTIAVDVENIVRVAIGVHLRASVDRFASNVSSFQAYVCVLPPSLPHSQVCSRKARNGRSSVGK